MPLTPRQREVLGAIVQHLTSRPHPPTREEICALTGHASTATLDHHLARLEVAGYVARDPHVPRGLRLLVPGFQVVPVVRCGACGQDMPADHSCRTVPPEGV